jgi:hypothetical protein
MHLGQRVVVVARRLGVVMMAALAASCDEPASNSPTGPSEPVASVIIAGPDSVAPGQSVRYSALVRLSDGTTKIPMSVRWQVSGGFPDLRVDETGLVTGVRLGEELLTAVVPVPGGTRGGMREIVVVPEGTFRLVGTVRDAEFPTMAIPGARVESIPGPAPTTTDADGRFRIYGVPPNADLRITRAGYEPLGRRLQMSTHASEQFSLVLSGPRPSLAGNYVFSIDVAPPCQSLPTDLQHRRYDAVVTQNGVDVEVTLTEPRVRLNAANNGNRFRGQADAGGARFTLERYGSIVYYYYYYYVGPSDYPSVAERLDDGAVLVPFGNATTTVTPTGLTGTLSGGLGRWGAGFPTSVVSQGSCTSIFGANATQFTLTRR